MPFGATSSVVAWHRIGRPITTIATRLLKVPILRYVDDFLAAERKETTLRMQLFARGSGVTLCIYLYLHSPVFHKAQAMQLFAQLVRLLLGHDAIAARKLEFGVHLVVLGIRVSCLTFV